MLFMVSLPMSILLNSTSYGESQKSRSYKSKVLIIDQSLISLVRCRLGSSMAGAANAYVQQRVLQVKNIFSTKSLTSFFVNIGHMPIVNRSLNPN